MKLSWALSAASVLSFCLVTAAGANHTALDRDHPPDPNAFLGGKVPPIKASDDVFVNTGTGFDTQCLFSTSNPVEFDIKIGRYIGDAKKLLNANPRLAEPVAWLYLSVFDVDGRNDFNWEAELDKVSINGHALPDSYIVAMTNCTWAVAMMPCSLEWLKFPSDPGDGHSPSEVNNRVKIEIDSKNAEPVYCMALDWAAIEIHVARPILFAQGIFSSPGVWDRFWRPTISTSGGLPTAEAPLPSKIQAISANGSIIDAAAAGLRQRCNVHKINLVTHSKGGIDARYFDDTTTGDRPDRIVEMAPPNAGSNLATKLLASIGMFGAIVNPTIDFLAIDNPGAFELVPWYMKFVFNRLYPPNPPSKYKVFAGEYDASADWIAIPWRALVQSIVGRGDLVVSKASALDEYDFGHEYFDSGARGLREYVIHTNQNKSPEIYQQLKYELDVNAAQNSQSIETDVDSTTLLAAYDSSMTTGQQYDVPFNVLNATSIAGGAFYLAGDADAALVAPDGTVMDSVYALGHPEVAHADSAFFGGRWDQIIVTHPVDGLWKLRTAVAANGTAKSKLACGSRVLGLGVNLSLELSTEKDALAPGESMRGFVKPMMGGTPITGLAVTGRIVKADDSRTAIAFNDAGTAGDSLAGDGTYTGQIASFTTEGPARLVVTSAGNAGGGFISMAGSSFFARAAGKAVPTGVYTPRLISANSLPGAEQLALDIGLSVSDRGTYRVSAILRDVAGDRFVGSGEATFNSGARTITALFDGHEIYVAKGIGPFVLETLSLGEVSGPTPILTSFSSTSWQSPAYTRNQFEHDPIELGTGGYATLLRYPVTAPYSDMEIRIPVELDPNGGIYTYSARLTDKDGHQIRTRLSYAKSLVGPVDTLYLSFGGDCIRRSGLNGPYQIRDLIVGSPAFTKVFPIAFETEAYNAMAFGRGEAVVIVPRPYVTLCPLGDADSLEMTLQWDHDCGCADSPTPAVYNAVAVRNGARDMLWDAVNETDPGGDTLYATTVSQGWNRDEAAFKLKKVSNDYWDRIGNPFTVDFRMNGYSLTGPKVIYQKSFDIDPRAMGSVDRFDSLTVWNAIFAPNCAYNNCLYADFNHDNLTNNTDWDMFRQHIALHHHVGRKLFAPNGGEEYHVSYPMDIAWSRGLGDSARVTLYLLRTSQPTSRTLLAYDLPDTGGAHIFVPISAQDGTDYKVEVIHTAGIWSPDWRDVGRDSTDGTFRIIRGGGGGCPTLDVAHGGEWLAENTILGRAANGQFLSDTYHLQSAPDTSNGRYAVRVRENEQEQTTLDNVLLATVDHQPGVTALPNGGSYILGTLEPAAQILDSDGVDHSSEMGDGQGGMTLQAGDTLEVFMVAPNATQGFETDSRSIRNVQSGGGGFVMSSMVKDLPPDELRIDNGLRVTAQKTAQALDQAVLSGTGLLLQVPNASGGWTTVEHDYPRDFFAESFYDSIDSDHVRVIAVGTHRLRFLGRVIPAASQEAQVAQWAPISASHTRLGDVRSAVSYLGGSNAALVPGDTLNLQFTASPAPVGAVRDFFFISRGVYTAIPNGVSGGAGLHVGAAFQFNLGPARPNPSTGRVTFGYTLARSTKVVLRLYNVAGRLVRTVVQDMQEAGPHEALWDGKNENGARVPAGVYFYRLQASDWSSERKLVVIQR